MHHHQQTLADLEREQQPDGWLLIAGAALAIAAVSFICAVMFTI